MVSMYYINTRLRTIMKARLAHGQKRKWSTGHTSNVGIAGKLLSHYFGAIFDHYDFSKLQYSRFCKDSGSANSIRLVVLPLTPLCSKPISTDPVCSSAPSAQHQSCCSSFQRSCSEWICQKPRGVCTYWSQWTYWDV